MKTKAEYSKEYRNKSYLYNLEIVKGYYGFPFKCSYCGFTSKTFAPFDMHHINSDTKEGTPSQLMKTSTGKFEKEMKKCILLCANCHRLHHHGDIALKKADLDIDIKFETRLSDNEIILIRELYKHSLYSRKEIAELIKINELTVWRYSKEISKSIKGKHNGRPSNNRKLDCETVRKIKDKTLKNRTNKSIAQEFNIDEHVVGRIKKGEAYNDCISFI